MGQTRGRRGKKGMRYTAYYIDIKGDRRSAGTYSNEKEASRAWQRAESRVAEGRGGDPRRGRQTVARYVEEWLPNHSLESRTRENYVYYLNLHILPHFGSMRLIEVLPSHVRDWIAKLKANGVSLHAIRYSKAILNALFTAALVDGATVLHPGHGVKAPRPATKSRRIITPEQFDEIYLALEHPQFRLLIELDIESGMRWGELTELRVGDIDLTTGVVTVSRVVEQLSRTTESGDRFVVRNYPKDKEDRSFKLSQHMIQKVADHVQEKGLQKGDLLFHYIPPTVPRARTPTVLPDPSTLGFTNPNAAGNSYPHGTTQGYSSGKCKCQHCRNAMAKYRAERRASGKDNPRKPKFVKTDGHIPRDWFRQQVWLPALKAAGLDFHVRVHGLRHAHASWLLAGGADLQVVKERLGHGSIKTTEQYLHTLPDADNTAIDALSRIRRRRAA